MTAAVDDCDHLEQTCLLADGELHGAEADRARDHLVDCAVCQAALSEALQLDAAVAEHTANDARRKAGVVSIAWWRRRPAQVATAAVAAAAAVVIYLALPQHDRPTAAPQATVALAPKRAIESRLAWSGAAAYRPYDVPRASEAPHETISLMSIAELDKRGDAHGVGVLELLNGERRQAATYLERASNAPAATTDVLADRAALALADHQPARALTLADAALAQEAGHGPALWNRALALRDLGLSRTAAAAFRAVAARKEPGWAGEAEQRAAALDAETDALEQRFQRINQASVALVDDRQRGSIDGQVTLSPDDARAMPGFARGVLYDAIRSATSADQLARLAPLGAAIDAADHDTAVADALARAGKALHPALSRQYADMIRALAVEMEIVPAGPSGATPPPSGAARDHLIAALRAAHADDLLIGVLMKLSADRSVVDRGDIAEFARLTAASPDPWMQLLGLQQQAQALLKQDDLVGAEAVLLRAKQRCAEPGAPGFRCVLIGRALGKLYLEWQRLPEARAALSTAWQLAQSSGEWALKDDLLDRLVALASQGDDTEGSGLPLVRAYIEEMTLRYPAALVDDRCTLARWGRTVRAMVLINQLQFDVARTELVGPECTQAQPPESAANELFVRAELAYHDHRADEIAAVRRQAALLRQASALAPAEQVWVDHSEGRAVIGADRAAGEALLRRAIATADKIPSAVTRAHKAAAWSYSVLIAAAARRGEGDAVFSLLGEEQRVMVPARCAVGLSVEDQERVIAVRDTTGKTALFVDDQRRTPRIDPARLVPDAASATLRDCAVVDVVARPPLHGMARVLPSNLAWRYLSPRPRPLGTTTGPAIEVSDVEPPAGLELPRLAGWSPSGQRIVGAAATPSRVLTAMATAGEVVVHAHGIVDVAQPDASLIALSPEADGRFALTTGDVRKAQFSTSPLIILAACEASHAAPVWHAAWSLPTAFIYAGARAVIASAAPIPDDEAASFFELFRAKAHAASSAAVALRDARQQWLAEHRGAWVDNIIVFE